MRIALDEYGSRTFIGQAKREEDYFCPVCAQKMIQKRGLIKTHHFSHPKGSLCKDKWNYDSSDWRFNWMSRFPMDCQEIVKTYDDRSHIADVLIEEHKTVFEFQHDPIPAHEIEKRNEFFRRLGYRVIWVLDAASHFENETLQRDSCQHYFWGRNSRAFSDLNENKKTMELYLEIQNDANENKKLADLTFVEQKRNCPLSDAEKEYVNKHKEDRKTLIKVYETFGSGISSFVSDGFVYRASDIVNRFADGNIPSEGTVRLGDLFDKLIPVSRTFRFQHLFGCPLTADHKCVNTSTDYVGKNDVRFCDSCDYSWMPEINGDFCKRRFFELGLNGNTQVRIEDHNDDGFISSISYDDERGHHRLDLPTFKNDTGKTIAALWKDDFGVAIFKNTKTGKFVKLSMDPEEQFARYNKVSGYISDNQYSFKGSFMQIYYSGNPEWICVWWAKKKR